MSRLASGLVVVVVGICALVLQASAQINHHEVHVFIQRIPILNSQGQTVATMSASNGVLTIFDATGNVLFQSSQVAAQKSYPPLSSPGELKADGPQNINTLRQDIDTLARSVTALTTRVNELSQP